jgi:hypothetical protein
MPKLTSRPSTRNLVALPEPPRLRALTKSIALLDEILCEDWDGRYYSFDPKWGAGEEMASMRDGSGDQWFLWFGEPGLVLLGFAHEAAPMTPYARADRSLWPGLLEGFPDALRAALEEPAFSPGDHTFCIWRLTTAGHYSIGKIDFPVRKGMEPFRSDPDGSAELLSILDDNPKTYTEWASEYYEQEVPLAAVEKVYAHAPIDRALVASLSEEADFETIAQSALAMGFDVSR